MSFRLYRLGRAMARHRLLVLAAWVTMLGVLGGGALLLNQGTDDTFSIPGSQSQDALDYLGRNFPEVSGALAQLVVVAPPGRRVDTPEGRAAVAASIARIRSVRQVATVVDPFGADVTGVVSTDHRAALVTVPLTVEIAEVTPATKDQLTRIAADLARTLGDGAEVHVGGDAFSDLVPRLSPTEGIGLVVALVVMLLVFGSLVAAGMPLVTAVVGVGISVGGIYLATLLVPISSTAPMLAVMVGLAVGIDYALFLLSRHRDQLAEGLPVEESIARATATAGSAVVFAGLTVMIALLGLFVVGIPFLTTMGVTGAVAVAVAVAVAITLIPALLSLAGDRLRPPTGRRRRLPLVGGRRRLPAGDEPRRVDRGRLSRRWVRMVTRAPAVTAVCVVAGLACCVIPAAHLRLALPDSGTEAPGSPARDTYDVVSAHFGPGYNGPLLVTVDVIASADPVGVTRQLADEIRLMPGVAVVPLATPDPKGQTAIIQVIPTTAPDSRRTEELVTALRRQAPHFQARYGTATAVTGITAVGIDVSARLRGALLPFGALVVGLSLVLLGIVFRSLWIPLKAAVGYLLSLGTAFGVTVFVFQDGHLAGPLGVTTTGSVISFLPIVLTGVLFGLAMDYEVFLVSRVREEYVHHGDARRAIEAGFVAGSRVVVAAAAIMLAVFAAFVPEGSPIIKPIAFSLAIGVFTDAFLIRMTLVPAVLALLGRRAWGLPPRLERTLPVFDVEGDALLRELRLADWPSPDADEAISARGLRLTDDRGHPVLPDLDIRLPRGEILALRGRADRSALLFALAGRVRRFDGDLKVLGRLLPQHAHAIRARVALVACRDTTDPARELAEAIADDAELLLVDDADLVVDPQDRAALRRVLADRRTRDGRPATVVLGCHDPARIADLLPPEGAILLDLLPPEGAGVAGLPSDEDCVPGLPSDEDCVPGLPSDEACVPGLPSDEACVPGLPPDEACVPDLIHQSAEVR